MKNILFTLIIIVCILPNISGQSFWDRLEIWEESITNDKGSIVIDISMIDKDDMKTVVDQSKIKMIQDESGYYANMFGFEFFSQGDIGLSVDHEDKRIVVTSIETIELQKQRLMQTTMLKKMAKYIKTEKIESDGFIHYKLFETENNTLLLEVKFDLTTNHVTWMRQHVNKQLMVDEQPKKVFVDMNYSYLGAHSKPIVSNFIEKSNGDWVCTAKFDSYQLIQN